MAKKASVWRLKESQSNDKRLQITMTSSYEMKKKNSSGKEVSITSKQEETSFPAATFECL